MSQVSINAPLLSSCNTLNKDKSQPIKGAAQQLESPSVFYKIQYNDNSAAATGTAECFTVSVSEVKHTSILPSRGDIDFHFLSLSFTLLSPLSVASVSPALTSPRSPPPLPSLFFLCVCLPSNSWRLKQPGLLREVNCTQIMFDRKRSEGGEIEKKRRDRGERDGCHSEKIIVTERDATIRVTLSLCLPVCRTAKTSHLDACKQLGR